MTLAALSPIDRAALRDLGELLCDCTRPGGRRDRARWHVRDWLNRCGPIAPSPMQRPSHTALYWPLTGVKAPNSR